jgi:flagellar biosynthesis protein FlhA
MKLRKFAGENSDLVLVVLMVGILVVLFTPIPAPLLDVLLIVNFSFALLILLITFYASKPVDFSTFPSLLLIATLFIAIAATRLILGDAVRARHRRGRLVHGAEQLCDRADRVPDPGRRAVRVVTNARRGG